jgi:hypothetical protein
VPSANNWYKVTIQDAQGATEIVYVRTRTSGSGILSNVIRGQEGTAARSFSAGAVVGLRLTALDVQQSINVLSNNNVFSGSNTFAGVVNFNQSATFNQASIFNQSATFNQPVSFAGTTTFSQNATFSAGLTGNVTGDVTGDVTGKFLTTSFTVQESGGGLAFVARNTFTASISSTVMTVSTATIGKVTAGATLTGTGVSGGTTIVGQLTSTETALNRSYVSGGEVGDTDFVINSATSIVAGQLVSGTGIPSGTFVSPRYVGGTRIPLVNRLAQPVAFTTQASGSYAFAASRGRGTYTVSTGQTVGTTTITGTKTVASLSYAGSLSIDNNVIASGLVTASGTTV